MDSWEIGIRLDAVEDAAAYADLVKTMAGMMDLVRLDHQRVKARKAAEAERAKENARKATADILAGALDVIAGIMTEEKPSAKRTQRRTSTTTSKAKRRPQKRKAANREGSCIGCATPLAFNVHKPLCRTCYRSHGDSPTEDAVCHACGTPHTATLEKPVCYSCYKALPKSTFA